MVMPVRTMLITPVRSVRIAMLKAQWYVTVSLSLQCIQCYMSQEPTPDAADNEPKERLGVSTPIPRKPFPALHHYRTPSLSSSSHSPKSGAPATARKASNKRTRVENSLDASVSENTKLLELAKGSYEFKTANLEAKRQKMELKAEQEREGQRYAAEERALSIKERMKDKEFEHRERMMKYELELARLKAPPPSAPTLGSAMYSPPVSRLSQGNFGHSTVYPTEEGSSTLEGFPFSTQHSPVGSSATTNSDVWRGL
jgi:hypothetical protein